MSITKERKAEVMNSFQRAEGDTGSPEVQVAVLTDRIQSLTGHLKSHLKDHAGRRGLLMMVSKRRGLLNYLKSHQPESYAKVVERLGLRK